MSVHNQHLTMLSSILLWKITCKVMNIITSLIQLKNIWHLCTTYKSQVYHSGTWLAVMNWKLPQAVSQSFWSGWKWNGTILPDNIEQFNTRWRGHQVGIKCHELNTSETWDWWFSHSWGKSSHAWQSRAAVRLDAITYLSYIATEPVRYQPLSLSFEWWPNSKICYTWHLSSIVLIWSQWEELSNNVSRDHWAILLQQGLSWPFDIWQCFFFLRTNRIDFSISKR